MKKKTHTHNIFWYVQNIEKCKMDKEYNFMEEKQSKWEK